MLLKNTKYVKITGNLAHLVLLRKTKTYLFTCTGYRTLAESVEKILPSVRFDC